MIEPFYQDEWATLYCGDWQTILPTLPMMDCTITDPPYAPKTHVGARSSNVSSTRSKETNKRALIGKPKKLIHFDSISGGDLTACFAAVGAKTRRWLVSFCDWHYLSRLERWADKPAAPLRFIRFGIWDKPNGAPQFTGDRPSTGWEAIAIMHQKDWRGMMRWNGGGKRAVWTCNREMRASQIWHPTQKPDHLLAMLVNDFTLPNEVVFDPFAGSGTTGVACKRNRRRCTMIERDPDYCAIAAKRLRETQPMMNFDAAPSAYTEEML